MSQVFTDIKQIDGDLFSLRQKQAKENYDRIVDLERAREILTKQFDRDLKTLRDDMNYKIRTQNDTLQMHHEKMKDVTTTSEILNLVSLQIHPKLKAVSDQMDQLKSELKELRAQEL
jgi:hypothetical protein